MRHEAEAEAEADGDAHDAIIALVLIPVHSTVLSPSLPSLLSPFCLSLSLSLSKSCHARLPNRFRHETTTRLDQH